MSIMRRRTFLSSTLGLTTTLSASSIFAAKISGENQTQSSAGEKEKRFTRRMEDMTSRAAGVPEAEAMKRPRAFM